MFLSFNYYLKIWKLSNWRKKWKIDKIQEITINVFVVIKISSLGDQKRSSVTHSKDYCEKKVPKSPDFEGNFSEIAILDLIGSSRLQKYSRILNKILCFTLTFSKIWLIPLVKDWGCSSVFFGDFLFRKMKKKNTKNYDSNGFFGPFSK